MPDRIKYYAIMILLGLSLVLLAVPSLFAWEMPHSFNSDYKDPIWVFIVIFSVMTLLIIFLTVNIFRRKRAESALRESEGRLRTVFEAAKNVSFIMTELTGNHARILEFSPGAEQIFGYRRKEIIGRPVPMLYPPENATKVLAAMESMQRKKTGFSGETILRRKNGEHFPVLFSTFPIFDKEDSLVATLGVSIDITQLRQTREALQQSEKQFRELFNSVSDLVYTHDLEGRFLTVNLALTKTFGYEQGEFIGRKIADFMNPEFRPLFESEYLSPLKLRGYNEGITSYFTKDGSEVYVEYHCTLVEPEDGDPYVSGTGRDVTERVLAARKLKKLQQQMNQAQKMEAIGVLAGGIAHDFNNLLMGIQGTASLLLVKIDSRHPDYQKLKNIEYCVQSGSELTKQLLGFARGGKYELKPTDLNDLIENQSRMFGRTKKEIIIHEKYGQDLWTVEVDRGQIERSLLNLYINAWQAMPGGGDLYVQTENVILGEDYPAPFAFTSGKYVKISVTDTGAGMDDATRQRVFEPFFTTKEMGRGTGLGLASVYGIIKNHGGFINVYSEKGEGTTFTIYLPAGKTDGIVAPGAEDQKEDEIQPGTETLLLVDDEAIILEVGGQMLEVMGYQVMTANSGKKALEMYRANRDQIDLVILDMIMPDMGGGDTYDQLKILNPEVKALLSSGYSLNGQSRDILERGCRGFIQKPFKLQQLSQKIREILAH